MRIAEAVCPGSYYMQSGGGRWRGLAVGLSGEKGLETGGRRSRSDSFEKNGVAWRLLWADEKGNSRSITDREMTGKESVGGCAVSGQHLRSARRAA